MSRYITDDDGRRWRIETTGMSHEGAGGVGGKGVWFINDQTQDKRIGRISLAVGWMKRRMTNSGKR